jgi:hypothetical protein
MAPPVDLAPLPLFGQNNLFSIGHGLTRNVKFQDGCLSKSYTKFFNLCVIIL